MDPSEEDDDIIAQQAALAQAKFGGLKKKNPVMQGDKKKFDSADYFTEHEKLKEAAGLGKQNEEEQKNQESQ
ncbi:UNKNOWN [Stylonychia lemnae]|uniref:Uncharacterized protein n=1 Tax=Stylonychia lemnae TaxID=5949 RepID=A0A078ADQ9_STYLE|nr:UNKNOWN [Stylonychia lemnae]|eukprot:CDW79667.1 UNKNOWN [Stylonychia lemnae]